MISIGKFETCKVDELKITDSSCDLKMIKVLKDRNSLFSYLHTEPPLTIFGRQGLRSGCHISGVQPLSILHNLGKN